MNKTIAAMALGALSIIPSVAADKSPTFAADIAPIIFNNCSSCHRTGQAAPFTLLSYDDVKKRGALIATVTKSRYMPPWHAAHGFGEFHDERRLTDEQIAQIDQWVKNGMPPGDLAKLPALPKFPEGWFLGKPDLVVTMPKGFSIPASGPDIYRNFAIPLNLPDDKWVRAIEFHPGTRTVVHHCLFSWDGSGSLIKKDGKDGHPGFAGMAAAATASSGSLGGWAVGATPVPLSDGLAYALPKGSDLVLQEHFHPTGKPEEEVSTVGIYFADHAPERTIIPLQLPALFGIGEGIQIPPGDKNYTVKDSFTVPVDVKIYAVTPHAHYIAKTFKAVATLPDGTTKPLLSVPDWDFAWQDRYRYKDPIVLPKNTRIDVEITYDNSDDNPRNPSSPPKMVWWGEGSFDEMGSAGFQSVAVRKEDEPALQDALRQRARKAGFNAFRDGTLKRLNLGPF